RHGGGGGAAQGHRERAGDVTGDAQRCRVGGGQGRGLEGDPDRARPARRHRGTGVGGDGEFRGVDAGDGGCSHGDGGGAGVRDGDGLGRAGRPHGLGGESEAARRLAETGGELGVHHEQVGLDAVGAGQRGRAGGGRVGRV